MRFRNIFFLLSAAIAMQACSTELDVNAPSRETKVVYCVLDPDPSLSFQTARVSRGFLSEGRSAYELAQIADSNLYNPANLEVNLLQLRSSSTGRFDTVGRYLMRAETINTKDTLSGDFYGPEQMVYRTDNFNLGATSNPDLMKYCLRVRNKISGKVSEAYTLVPGSDLSILNKIEFDLTPPNTRTIIGLIPLLMRQTNTRFEIKRTPNTAFIQLIVRWKLKVFLEDGTSRMEEWLMPSGYFDQGGTTITGSFDSKTFYDALDGQVRIRGNKGVVKRTFVSGTETTMEILAGNADYDNYRTVNNNFNSFSQSQPVFTNFSNGALGILCAKNRKTYLVDVPASFDVAQVIEKINQNVPGLKLENN